MDFYTFVDITPQLFKNTQKNIPNIDYVYTDNTGKVIKKTISESGDEIIPDDISIVHLVLERDEKVYKSKEHGYADILSATCSTIEYRNQLIKILGGEPIEIKPTGDFSDDEDEDDNESVDNKETDYMYNAYSPSSSPKPSTPDLRIPSLSLDKLSTQSTPRTGMKPGWNTSSRPLSATSAQSTTRLSSEEQARLLDPSKLPEKTSTNNTSNKAAKIFANNYNSGNKPDDRVKALKNVKKENQSAVLKLFTDKEPSKGKGGLPERHVVESHFNHFNHLANEGSRPPSGSSQQTLIKPGRRALVFDAGSYKIGIIGPYKKSDDPDDPSKPDTYFIDVPNKSGTFYITEGMFENKDKKPKSFRDGYYSPVNRVMNKPRNNIYVLNDKSLTQLRKLVDSGRTSGGKKTKKVHPAKKNITRSKRR